MKENKQLILAMIFSFIIAAIFLHALSRYFEGMNTIIFEPSPIEQLRLQEYDERVERFLLDQELNGNEQVE